MPTYSHSKLSTFEQCPLKFKFKYVERLTPDFEESIEGFLGNKVHETIEWIYKQIFQGIRPELDNIIQHYIKSWNKDFNNEIKIINQEFDSEYYFNQGIKFLINYSLENAPFKDDTIAIEKKVIVNLDLEGEYKIQGVIDRLVHDKEKNILEIHDYKTGSPKSQDELDNDKQLALYGIAVKEAFKNVRDIHLIWHFLAFREKRISKRTEEQFEKLRQEIIQLIDRIESTKNFPSKPSALCKWCEFKSYCSVFGENN